MRLVQVIAESGTAHYSAHFPEVLVFLGSPSLNSNSHSDDINDSENHNPNSIDKMPIQGENLCSFRVFFSYFSQKSTRHYEGEAQETNSNVKRVETNERVVGRSE
jgi:hypothetical protein